jgi:hypothetical protein
LQKILVDGIAIRQVIQDDPKVCKRKYKFDSVEESIYPLSMLCALGAELETIILAYEEYPQALTYSDDFIGTPLHYACAFQAPSKCVVSFLLSMRPSLKSSVNMAGRSPIALAKLNHHYDAVLELLD